MATQPEFQGMMTFETAMRTIGLTPHPEQLTISGQMDRVRNEGRIGFIEAPTATGKTHVMAHHALNTAVDGGKTIIIAAPTIEIVHQTLSVINRLAQAADAYRLLKSRIILGRGEFVSIDAVKALTESADAAAAKAIEEWLASGGPGPQLGYPMHTIRGLEATLDRKGVSMTIPGSIGLEPGDMASAAALSYKEQFAEHANILVVTHSMLARDLVMRYIATSKERRAQGMTSDHVDRKDRWLLDNAQRLEVETGEEGKLPDYRRLIVDEAHLLINNVERALTTGIALNPLIRHVETLATNNAKAVPQAVLKELKTLREKLSDHPMRAPGEMLTINWSDHKGLGTIIEHLHDALAKVKFTGVTEETKADAIAIDRARYALRESMKGRDAVRTQIEWSPVVTFPSITVGRKFLGGEMRLLWDRLESAALLSATLYTQTISGPSASHMAARLFTPEGRRKEFRPVEAKWLRDPVTVYLPGEAMANDLLPDDGNGRKRWIGAMANAIVATEKASDGTLVLSTSRSTTHELAQELSRQMGEERIIDGSRMRLSQGRLKYVELHGKGKRPIWISQGPAWTGLDVPDETIDTLIVTRIPFLRPEVADTSGEKNGNYSKQASTMMMTLKQGIGRLVRSRNAGPKKVYVLDGRIHTNARKSAKPALALLKTYRIVRITGIK